jgi:S1-C subfamily serine protease
MRKTRPLRVCLAAGACLCLFFSATSSRAAGQPDIRRDAVVGAIEKVMPSVVNIATETVVEYHDWYDELLRQFYGARGPRRQQKSVSLGSGVIIDEEGYVLTNLHVIRRASRIHVKLWDGREYVADPHVATTDSDVALIKLRAKPDEKFLAMKFAPDDDLLLGETVLALGNPFGLGGSVTKGILSSKNRRPATGDEPLNYEDWLQTDAAINPGNSGGPLVNLRGELIGLNVAVYREEHGERGLGVGFSIPVKQVSAALSRFFTPEVSDSLWFGAHIKAGPGPLSVTSVQSGSPAAQAGLREGDHILQVNSQPVPGLIRFNRALVKSDRHLAKLAIRRGSEQVSSFVKLVPFDALIRRKLGLTAVEVTAQSAEQLGVPAGQGLYIQEVEKDGPAARVDLRRGHLLAGIDGASVGDLRTAGQILSNKKKGDTTRLNVVIPRRIGNYVELRQAVVEAQVR